MSNEPHGDLPLQQDVDPFLGAEPTLPQGPEEINAPTPEELTDPSKREQVGESEEAVSEEEANAEEVPTEEANAEEATEQEELSEESGEEATKTGSRPSWKAYRKALKESKERAARAAELEKEQAANQAKLELFERQMREYREEQQRMLRGEQEDAKRPGIDRPLTVEELEELREQDPITYVQVLAESAAVRTQQVERMAQEAYRQQIAQRELDTFRQAQPDYDQAVEFLREREINLAKAAGASDEQIEAYLNSRAVQLVQLAAQAKKSVPEAAYSVARAYGWAPQTTPSPPPAVKTAPKDIVRAAKQRANVESASLGAVAGTSGSRVVYTAADVARMSEAEMERLEQEDPNWASKVVP